MLDHGGKQREEKLKTKTNRRRKRNKEIKVIFTIFVLEKIFNNYTPQLFQNIIDRSYMPTHLFQNIQNAQLHKQGG